MEVRQHLLMLIPNTDANTLKCPSGFTFFWYLETSRCVISMFLWNCICVFNKKVQACALILKPGSDRMTEPPSAHCRHLCFPASVLHLEAKQNHVTIGGGGSGAFTAPM